MFLSRELLHCGLITLGKGLNGIHTLNILFLKLGDVEREPPLPLTHLGAKKMPELVNHNSSLSFFSLHCQCILCFGFVLKRKHDFIQ